VNTYEAITNRIIASLEAGVIPWRKPWKASAAGSAFPHNFTTGKSYRGVNILSLLCSPYTSTAWLTYKQAQDMGAQVRKGERGSPVVFWKFDRERDADTGKLHSSAFMRQYTVFNVEQVDGLQPEIPFEIPAFDSIASAQGIVDGYLTSANHPTLAHGGDAASYRPSTDHVQMPHAGTFTTAAEYYCTLFHEFSHSTGHASRLDRAKGMASRFGSEGYSDEELVAEFSASFLCAEAQVSNDALLDNSAAYIANWLHVFRNDSKLAIYAAQRAQKAADFILQRTAAAAETVAAEEVAA
jgi:antirestriction protein ArdC